MPAPEWPTSPWEAASLQRELAALVKAGPKPRRIRVVAGVDVAYDTARKINVGAAVLLSYPDFALLEWAVGTAPTTFPYVPGLLSFREAPLSYELLEPIKDRFDVLIVDGQGLAHARRFGLASHLGVLLERPTIGVAKSRLVGEEPRRLGQARGSRAPLIHKGERVGTVLRTQKGVKPIYVSVGHLSRLEWAEELALALAPKFRLVEPVRAAHRLVTLAKERVAAE